MNAIRHPIATDLPEWQHKPSERYWQVMIHGGLDPRTGLTQDPQEFQFFLGHYTCRQIIARAQSMAELQFRDFFMVRGPDGKVVHHGQTYRANVRFADTVLSSFGSSPSVSPASPLQSHFAGENG